MKALFAQYRIYAELAALVILASACWWFVLHERGIGEDKIKAKDAQLVAAQIIKNSEVEHRANQLAANVIGTLKAQLAAAPATDAPHLRLCDNSRSASSLPKDARTRSDTATAEQQPAVVQSTDTESWDPGPAIDKRFADDDALIAALQKQLELEKGICR